MATNLAVEDKTVTPLRGMPGNPGRDPKARGKEGVGSIGDKAFTDAVLLVIVAWAVLIFLAVSLRHHNI